MIVYNCIGCENGELLTRQELCLQCNRRGKHDTDNIGDNEW